MLLVAEYYSHSLYNNDSCALCNLLSLVIGSPWDLQCIQAVPLLPLQHTLLNNGAILILKWTVSLVWVLRHPQHMLYQATLEATILFWQTLPLLFPDEFWWYWEISSSNRSIPSNGWWISGSFIISMLLNQCGRGILLSPSSVWLCMED